MDSFNRYAEYYDIIYRDKDYAGECDFIEEIFRRYSPVKVESILEAGSGTGGHALVMAGRGYRVTGVDGSESMIARAKSKAGGNQRVDFRVMDLRKLDLEARFDACLSMFAVIDYITETADLLKVLGNIRSRLEKGGLFAFDVWNGLAVLRIMPSDRAKEIEGNGLRIFRTASSEMDAFNHICRVHYHLLVHRGDRLVDEIKETHTVRYFFPQEIKHYLETSGFEVLKICPFLEVSGKVDENVWNIEIIARAV